MAELIRKETGIQPNLVKGDQGAFEIRKNNELIYSKIQTGEFPDYNQIVQSLK